MPASYIGDNQFLLSVIHQFSWLSVRVTVTVWTCKTRRRYRKQDLMIFRWIWFSWMLFELGRKTRVCVKFKKWIAKMVELLVSDEMVERRSSIIACRVSQSLQFTVDFSSLLAWSQTLSLFLFHTCFNKKVHTLVMLNLSVSFLLNFFKAGRYINNFFLIIFYINPYIWTIIIFWQLLFIIF